MKFQVETKDLQGAIEVANTVTPKPVGSSGAGFLFVVRGERCYLYSNDGQRVARADFPIADVEGEGAFVFPLAHIGVFKYMGPTVSFTTSEDANKFIVEYQDTSGSKTKRTTLNPKLFTSCDAELNAATEGDEFPPSILKEAIRVSRSFVAGSDSSTSEVAEEHFKTIQIFDKSVPDWARGDGVLYAASSKHACYFECEAFKGKSIEIHSEHLPLLTSFLSKAEGVVRIKKGTNYTFAVDTAGRAVGWVKHVKTHGKYSYYKTSSEQFVLKVGRDPLMYAINRVRTELDKSTTKVKVIYDHEDSTLRLSISEGNTQSDGTRVPVSVVDPEASEERKSLARERGFELYVNVNHFMNLIESNQLQETELRVVLIPRDNGKESAYLRTIDRFKVEESGKVPEDQSKEGLYPCKVTRYVPSMI